MLISNFTLGLHTFYDDVNFPRGFGRSGDFSCKEAQLLALYGSTMNTIARGTLPPCNDEERRFIDAICGQVIAETPLEKVWLKYIKLTSTPKLFFPLSGGKKVSKQPALDAVSD